MCKPVRVNNYSEAAIVVLGSVIKYFVCCIIWSTVSVLRYCSQYGPQCLSLVYSCIGLVIAGAAQVPVLYLEMSWKSISATTAQLLLLFTSDLVAAVPQLRLLLCTTPVATVYTAAYA